MSAGQDPAEQQQSQHEAEDQPDPRKGDKRLDDEGVPEKENENPNSQEAQPAESLDMDTTAANNDTISARSDYTSHPSTAEQQQQQQQQQGSGSQKGKRKAGVEPEEGGDTSCAFCGQFGELVFCDTCSRAFHYLCAKVTRDEVKASASWSCSHCTPIPVNQTGTAAPSTSSSSSPSSRLRLRRNIPTPLSSSAPESEPAVEEDGGASSRTPKRARTTDTPDVVAPPSSSSSIPPAPTTPAQTPDSSSSSAPSRTSSIQMFNSTNITARASQHTTSRTSVQGPTSALSSFLAEKGIQPRGLNRWRPRQPQQPEEGQPPPPEATDQPAQAQRTQSDITPAQPVSSYARRTRTVQPESRENSTDSPNVRFEYVMEVRGSHGGGEDKGKKKTKEGGEDSDFEEDIQPKKSRWGRQKDKDKEKEQEKEQGKLKKLEKLKLRKERKERRAAKGSDEPPSSSSSSSESDDDDAEYHFRRVAVCGTCGTQFPDGVLRCAKCSQNKRAAQPIQKKIKKASAGTILREIRGQIKPLQQLCIEVKTPSAPFLAPRSQIFSSCFSQYICKNIDCVESFGDIASDVFDKIATLACRHRLLNDTNIHLFVGSNVDRLRLCDCADLTSAALSQIAKKCPDLKFLDLNRCGRMTDATLAQIADGCPLITEVRLGGAFLVTDEAFAYFIKSHPKLKQVVLDNAPKAGLQTLQAVSTLAEAAVLTFANCMTLDDALVKNLKTAPVLKELTLSHSAIITNEGASAVLDSVSSAKLTALDLSSCLCLNDSIAKKIAAKFPRLQELSLEGCQITDEGGIEIASSCTRLKKLSLRRTLVGNETLQAIAVNAGKHLIHLNLNGLQEISEDTLVIITENCPNLEEVDLSWLRAVDDAVIAKFLAAAPNLSKICVWGCNKITDCAFAPRAADVGRSLKVLGQFIVE